MDFNQFFADLWLKYPKDLCHNKKGAKIAATNAAKKIKPDQYQYILNCMDELTRYDRKDREPDRWPHLSTWLNQGYYDRDVVAYEERQQVQELPQCQIEGCISRVHGPNYSTCSKHIPHQWQDQLRQAYREAGLQRSTDESVNDWLERLKQHRRNRAAVVDSRINKT